MDKKYTYTFNRILNNITNFPTFYHTIHSILYLCAKVLLPNPRLVNKYNCEKEIVITYK